MAGRFCSPHFLLLPASKRPPHISPLIIPPLIIPPLIISTGWILPKWYQNSFCTFLRNFKILCQYSIVIPGSRLHGSALDYKCLAVSACRTLPSTTGGERIRSISESCAICTSLSQALHMKHVHLLCGRQSNRPWHLGWLRFSKMGGLNSDGTLLKPTDHASTLQHSGALAGLHWFVHLLSLHSIKARSKRCYCKHAQSVRQGTEQIAI